MCAAIIMIIWSFIIASNHYFYQRFSTNNYTFCIVKQFMIESSDIFDIMIYTNFQYSLCQSVLHRFIHYHCVFASPITSAIDPFHKSLDALDEYTTVQHMLIEMIYVTKWCIVVYRTGAIWNLENGCITGSSNLFVDSCIGANCRHKYFTEQIMLREKFTHRITLYEKNTGKGTRHPNWSHLLIVIQLTRSLEFRKLLRFILVPVPPTSIRSNSKSNEILEFFCSSQNAAHAPTIRLSWPVQTFVVIGWAYFLPDHSKFWSRILSN